MVGIGAAAILAAAFGWTMRNQQRVVVSTVQRDDEAVTQPALENPTSRFAPINAMKFVDVQTVHFAVTSTDVVGSGRVVAGVVNHHVLAVDVLARFWASIAAARPDVTRIIIISPDHYARGTHPISVHERTYLTQDGNVTIDATATRELLTDPNIGEENGTMFENEHGIGALMPFMHHALPQARVVPIAIRGNCDIGSAMRLGDEIRKITDDHTLVVVSSDMSHYLDEKTALTNDISTEHWFETRDVTAMEKATDRNTDNGLGFVALFEFLGEKQSKFTRIDHRISTEYGGPIDNTTSYITGVWGASGS